jgi:16S rRNA (adenine1518-N6/adenine1519-N6)-dimethyltransferase
MLLAQAGEVLAIEKDARLVSVLRARFDAHSIPAVEAEQRGVLELVQADALHYLRAHERDWNGWKLVANLPYSVASPLLVDLAQARRGPDRLVATLQIEVAKRLVALHGNGDYGVLTLLVQLDYEPQGWFKIPASCFFPEPDVDSACVCLVRRPQALLPQENKSTFIALVKRGFSQRRKMMLKLLKQDWPVEKLEHAFEQLHISRLARAEVVSLEQFVRLTQILRANSEPE